MSTIEAAVARIAAATSVCRTRRDDRDRVTRNGGTAVELAARIARRARALEADAIELERRCRGK